jgi:hypothetical protein
MIVCAAVLVALAAAFCAAQDSAPAPEKSPGEPAVTGTQLHAGAGQAVNGLQLTLMADRLVLPETPGPPGQPLVVAPVALQLLFRNVSDRPIVLDAYNLALSRLSLIVVGPEKETVAVTRKPLAVRTREALPIDYPQIEPGNPFVPMWGVAPLQFPGDFNLLVNYSLYKPGEYKVQVIYSRPAGGAPENGVWQGMVVSNTLTFRIAGPMPPAPDQPPETAPQPAPTPSP